MTKKILYSISAIILLLSFAYVVYLQRAQIKDLSTKNTELTEQLESINTYYKKQFESIQNINTNLQNKLDSISSNECGKEEVPQYLIDASKDILKGA